MKITSFHAVLVVAIIFLGARAHAVNLQCVTGLVSTVEGVAENYVSYDEYSERFIEGTRLSTNDGDPVLPKVTLNAKLVPVQSPQGFVIRGAAGETLATFQVMGHPLKPDVRLVKDGKLVSCVLVTEPAEVYERLVTDPRTRDAIATWKKWLRARPAACSHDLDSVGYFQPGADRKIALVLHGYASNPRRMHAVVEGLLENGYNVIVPRLSRHFTTNLRELDNSRYMEWVADSEAAFNIAMKFGNEVTLVGFSMGGLLASRLAIKNTNTVNKLVLFAPAWRVSPTVSMGGLVGSIFRISLNDIMKDPESCKVDDGYVPSVGARQVENLVAALEMSFEGTYPEVTSSAFRRIQVPHVIFTTPGDEAIGVDAIQEICSSRSYVCGHVSVPNRTHTSIIDDLSVKAGGGFSGRSINDLMNQFLRAE